MTKRKTNTYQWIRVVYDVPRTGWIGFVWIENTNNYTLHLDDSVIFTDPNGEKGIWVGKVVRRSNHPVPKSDTDKNLYVLGVTRQYLMEEIIQPELPVVPEAVRLLEYANQIETIISNLKGVLANG